MPLVEYSDSGSGSEPERPGAIQGSSARSLIKRKRDQNDSKRENPGHTQPLPPPLPAGFHDLYASGTRASVVDDPDLHGGRQRLTPHVQGNWATHVYLECKSSVIMTTDYHAMWRMPADGFEGILRMQSRSDCYNCFLLRTKPPTMSQ